MQLFEVELSAAQLWLLGGAGTLATLWITHRLGKNQAERGQRLAHELTAKKDFRAAMNELMVDFPLPYKSWHAQIEQIKTFERVSEIAAKNFVSTLRWKDQFAFDGHATLASAYAHRLVEHYDHPIERLHGSAHIPQDIQKIQKSMLNEARAMLRFAGQFV